MKSLHEYSEILEAECRHEPGLGGAALRLLNRVYDLCVGLCEIEIFLFLVNWT